MYACLQAKEGHISLVEAVQGCAEEGLSWCCLQGHQARLL